MEGFETALGQLITDVEVEVLADADGGGEVLRLVRGNAGPMGGPGANGRQGHREGP